MTWFLVNISYSGKVITFCVKSPNQAVAARALLRITSFVGMGYRSTSEGGTGGAEGLWHQLMLGDAMLFLQDF